MYTGGFVNRTVDIYDLSPIEKMSKTERNQKEEFWSLVRKDGKTHPILGGMMFIGREECDVILRSPSADKRHAVIFFDCSSDEIRIKDLNSTAGTYVNGMRIPEQSYVKLKHSDSLRFGYGSDVFHIQKWSGIPLKSLFLKQNISCDAEDFLLGRPQDTKNCHQSLDTNMPVEKAPDEMPGKGDDVIQLQEADSLEDIKQDAPFDLAPPVQLRRKKNGSVTCPPINTGTFKKNSSDNTCHSSHSTSPGVEYSNHENPDAKEMHRALSSEDPSCQDKMKRDPSCLSEPEKSQSLSDSSPSAMAFTVAFDNVTPKKKLSIKDSISKYAPKKTDAMERSIPRPKSEKSAEPIIKKLMCSETKAATKPEVKISHGESTLEDLEDGWKIVNKYENMKNKERQLSDGATYLIRKMFNGQSKLSSDHMAKSPSLKESLNSFQFENHTDKAVEQPSKSSPSPVKDDKALNDDNKSETGTYTIEGDLDDAAVKEARKKIDEVFNVMIPEETHGKEKLPSSKDASLKRCNKGNKEAAPSDGESKQINNILDGDSSTKSINSSGSGVPIRPKRRLPVPPVQPSSVASDYPLDSHRAMLLNYGTYSVKNRDSLMNQMSKSDIMLRDHSSGERSPLTKETLALNPQTSRFIPQNRFTLNDLQLNKLQNFHPSNELGYDHNFQFQTPVGGHWRRSPWNLSGSDLELDQMKVETASVLSDVSASTEPTSLNSGKKNEHSPLMKFNRAFNLRRARLGLDADTPKSNSFKDTCVKNKNSHLAPPAPSLSRQDGGRFSLRLPKSTVKSGNNKISTKTPVNKPVANAVAKCGHRRNESDPGKTSFLRKGDGLKSSDPVKHTPTNPSLLRSSSFSSDIDGDDDNVRRLVKKAPATRLYNRQDTITVEKSFDNKQPFVNFHQDPKSNVNNSKDTEKCFNAFEKENKNDCEAARSDDVKDDNQVIKNKANNSKQLYAMPPFQKQKRELSALDSLVISAILQLSNKLKQKAHLLLEKERNKFPLDSTERLTIEEMLPQVLENRSGDSVSEGISRDLSSILKNLKRVEQSLEVLAAVGEDQPKEQNKTPASSDTSFFVVDV